MSCQPSSTHNSTYSSSDVPEGTLSVTSSNRSALDTLWEDVDSLWDDVGAMRREFSALVDDVYETKEEVTEIQDALVEQSQDVQKQSQMTAQLESSVALLRTEVGSMNVQMSILKEKNRQMEQMLALLLQANPEVQAAYDQSRTSVSVSPKKEQQMNRSFTRKLDRALQSEVLLETQ